MVAVSIKAAFKVAISIKEGAFEAAISRDGEMARDGIDAPLCRELLVAALLVFLFLCMKTKCPVYG